MRYLLILLILLTGCKAKNKVTQRTNEKQAIEVKVDRLEKVETDEVFDVVTNTGTETNEVTDNTTVEIEADPSGVVTREVKKTDTGFIETFSGVKKVVVSNQRKNTVKKDTTTSEANYRKDSSSVKKEQSVIRIKNETKERKTDVEIRSTSTWFWLAILVVALFVIWINRRKIGMWF